MHSALLFRRLFPLIVCAALLWHAPAQAVPAFARQTGLDCAACHLGAPELTPEGRAFKLSGYTLGSTSLFPLSATLTASHTGVANNTHNYPKNNQGVIEGGSLFIAGKLDEHIGIFSKWTYDNLASSTDDNGSTRFDAGLASDNTDLRFVGHSANQDQDLIYGLSLNNNPTRQDAWNTTPALSFPYQVSNLSYNTWLNTPPAPLIAEGLAQQAVGLSAYALLNRRWYVELGDYQAADGKFGLFSRGVSFYNRLEGNNPYWRLAWNRDWGPHSLEIGTFGLDAHVSVDPGSNGAPSNHFRDIGLDAQYQYLSEPHSVSMQASYIDEHTNWNQVGLGVNQSNNSDTLHSAQAKISYWYRRQWGLTLGVFHVDGSHDALLYPTSANGSPNTRGQIVEFDYMPRPWWRLGLQYTAYNAFMGAATNYDGNGSNAHDNNTLYLYSWVAF
ncbi:cytochrome C [Paludibacterium purpuratum]|uniref:Cytochrome c domain-containing protein n=1 Tax=Paludibacterium purpuratum TaxID=1144873 RepID=A0A4R7AZA0_9NEIS|nr:cytochrome C [Paludibacterium purpuratum]TDR73574.1 hypothetical protein DFP86_11381 [Paludibacterium purpuratum]